MAAIPVILNGVFLPKAKGADDKPIPAIFAGYLSRSDLEIWGGPGPDQPHVEHPIVLPDPPIDPPTQPPSGPQVVVVIKPAPETGGWGLATDANGVLKWFLVPQAQPKGR